MLQLFIPFFYFFPVLYIQFLTARYHKEQNDEMMRWFTLETFVFNSQVFGGVLFMLVAYYLRFYSIWNKSKPDIVSMNSDDDDKVTFIPNIFYKRKTADFMHYMKFEAFNWILDSSFLSLDIMMLFIHYSMEGKDYGVANPRFVVCTYVMIFAHVACLIVYSYHLSAKHSDGDKYWVLPKKVTLWQYALLGIVFCCYVYVSVEVYSFSHTEKYIL